MIASCLPLHGKPYILLPYFTCKAEDQHLQNKHTLPHIQWQTNTISSYRIQHVRNLQNQHIHFHTSMANQYFHFTYKEDQPLQNQHTLPHIQWQTNTISSYRIQHGKRPQNQHIHFHTSMENYKNTLSTLS